MRKRTWWKLWNHSNPTVHPNIRTGSLFTRMTWDNVSVVGTGENAVLPWASLHHFLSSAFHLQPKYLLAYAPVDRFLNTTPRGWNPEMPFIMQFRPWMKGLSNSKTSQTYKDSKPKTTLYSTPRQRWQPWCLFASWKQFWNNSFRQSWVIAILEKKHRNYIIIPAFPTGETGTQITKQSTKPQPG